MNPSITHPLDNVIMYRTASGHWILVDLYTDLESLDAYITRHVAAQ